MKRSTVSAPRASTPVPRPASNDPVWPQLLSRLEQEGAAVAGVLANARLESITDGVATIFFDPGVETFARRMGTNGKREQMSRILSELTGKAVSVKFEMDNALAAPAPRATPAPRSTFTPRPAQAPAPAPTFDEPAREVTPEERAEIEKDPMVRAAITEFAAKIVRIE